MRAARAPKPIAPNPWRRGRRRSHCRFEGTDQIAGTAGNGSGNGAGSPIVVGLFSDRENAERALRSVSERGYDRDSVNLVINADGMTDGLIGALIGSGIPEEQVADYESAVKNGGILLSVQPRSAADAEHFEKEWKAYSVDNVRG